MHQHVLFSISLNLIIQSHKFADYVVCSILHADRCPSFSVSSSAIEAISLQGRKEETSLVSTGSYVIGNTSLDFQRGADRQTLRTHGPLNADYIIKVKQRNKNSSCKIRIVGF